MKKVYLFSTVFLWVANEKGLLYNGSQGTYLRFRLNNDAIKDVCSQWQNLQNLYVAKYDEQSVDDDFIAFIRAIEENGLGKLVDGDQPVVSIPPYLKIRHDADKFRSWGADPKAEPILPYLTHLKVFCGGAGDGRDWWKQVAYPMTSTVKLEAARFFGFLEQCDKQTLKHIDLIISEWDIHQISVFTEGLAGIKNKTRFFFAHPDPSFRNEILDSLVAKGYAVTQVCRPVFSLKKVAWIPDRDYRLLVRSEEDYTLWESLLQESAPRQYVFDPIADDNVDFFRNNVFISEEDILARNLSRNDIFRHQALNLFHFGVFYVFPDGTIHPAADAPAIGTLDDSVYQVIIHELEENHAWRQTRRLKSPCKDCIYHDLCPSPSVYERILGTPSCYFREGI